MDEIKHCAMCKSIIPILTEPITVLKGSTYYCHKHTTQLLIELIQLFPPDYIERQERNLMEGSGKIYLPKQGSLNWSV